MKPDHKRDALLRLKTVRGHLDGVIAMVEREDYCPDLMKQVAALQASLEKVNRVLLQNHLETCVTEAIAAGSGDAKIAELLVALRYTSALTDLRERFDPVPLPAADSAPLPRPAGTAGPAPPAHQRGGDETAPAGGVAPGGARPARPARPRRAGTSR
jgi:DNA-binding FrmR family transcriptional regulator